MNPTSAARGPLAGVRILDMATVVAAPFSASLCADLGADVVKLELPDGSDPLRALAPTTVEHHLYWKVLNRGKRGISLDVRKPQGRATFLELIADYDVLVENFRPGTLDRWGLDALTLREANPGLIVLRLTGFGQSGPYADRPGFARIFEAMSGLAHLTGEAGRSPQHMNYPLGDMMAGLFGAFSIAATLAERARNPQAPGRDIDLSATDALVRLLEALPAEHEHLGLARQRAGSRATYTAPSNMYETSDGIWVTLVASSEPIFRRLCTAIGMPGLPDDERFATNRMRTTNLEALDAVIADWAHAHTFAELDAALAGTGVPYSKVYSIEDVVADPHFIARGTIIRLPDDQLGSIPGPAIVPRVSGFSPSPPKTGPATGADNAEVYGRVGIDAAALEVLRRGGIV